LRRRRHATPVSPLDRSPDAADRAVDPALAGGEVRTGKITLLK